jgi:zinc D-Ala-D-Ala dipeptidase
MAGIHYMRNKKYSMPELSELQAIPSSNHAEHLVNLADISSDILCDYRRDDTNIKAVLVRQAIADKLQRVQKHLTLYDSKMQLLVVEGFRCPYYQEYYYLKQLLLEYKKDPDLEFSSLLEKVHQLVALPSVAGHPTGGAIDLTLAYEGHEIDMDGEIADFSIHERLPTYSSLVTLELSKM